MGDGYQEIVDESASADSALRLANIVLQTLIADGVVVGDESDCVLGRGCGHRPGPNWAKATGPAGDSFLTTRTNGLSVIAERTVFHSGPFTEHVFCPKCGADAIESIWSDAVDC